MSCYEFPHTTNYENDLSFLIDKYKELIAKVDGLSEDILIKANQYTDVEIQKAFNDIQNLIDDLNANYITFVSEINSKINVVNSRLNQQDEKLERGLNYIESTVQLRIDQNNEYIFDKIANEKLDIKVINYFTGELVSVQAMLDYLAQFHLDNAITFDQLIAKQKTYTQLIAYDMSYTDLALNGNSIIS